MKEYVSLVLSFAAIMISAIHALFEVHQMKRVNDLSMKAKYYNDVFDEHLIKKIPIARQYIRFVDCRISDTNKLTDELDEMMKDALFFKYDNRAFYNELKGQVNDLEDYISDCCNRSFEQDEQAIVYVEISKRIEVIYKTVSMAYVGNKRMKKQKINEVKVICRN